VKTGALLLMFATISAAQVIEGDLIDGFTQAPVAGAHVNVFPLTGGSGGAPASSGADGHFRIPAPVGTSLGFRVVRTGYLGVNKALTLKPGQSLAMQVELIPEAVLSGKIEDEDGFPVEFAMVQVMQYQLMDGRRELRTIATTQSDDLGDYRVAGIPAGRYVVRAEGNSPLRGWDARYRAQYLPGGLSPANDGLVEMKAGQQRTGVNVHLKRVAGVRISGRVLLPGGVPMTQSTRTLIVLNSQNNWAYGGSAWASSDGSFFFPQAPAGQYTFLPAALIFRCLRAGLVVGIGSELPPAFSCRSSAICASMRFF
jgi:hypothetical protein